MKRMMLVVALLAISSFAQAPKPKETAPSTVAIPVLSAEEQLNIRNLEIDQMKALDAQKTAVQALPQTKALEVAVQRLQEAVQVMFKTHKVDTGKLAFCDGPMPQEPLCKDVKPGELAFRARPAQEAKK